jgi:hypothetical protein
MSAQCNGLPLLGLSSATRQAFVMFVAIVHLQRVSLAKSVAVLSPTSRNKYPLMRCRLNWSTLS